MKKSSVSEYSDKISRHHSKAREIEKRMEEERLKELQENLDKNNVVIDTRTNMALNLKRLSRSSSEHAGDTSKGILKSSKRYINTTNANSTKNYISLRDKP